MNSRLQPRALISHPQSDNPAIRLNGPKRAGVPVRVLVVDFLVAFLVWAGYINLVVVHIVNILEAASA
jgi:hypothetical protein